jgi:hypothetical protein
MDSPDRLGRLDAALSDHYRVERKLREGGMAVRGQNRIGCPSTTSLAP